MLSKGDVAPSVLFRASSVAVHDLVRHLATAGGEVPLSALREHLRNSQLGVASRSLHSAVLALMNFMCDLRGHSHDHPVAASPPSSSGRGLANLPVDVSSFVSQG